MKYAIIKNGTVENVILCEPDNLCQEAPGHCQKWHPPVGCECVPAGESPNTGDPKTRPAGPRDLATKARGGWQFEQAPDPEPVPDPREADFAIASAGMSPVQRAALRRLLGLPEQ